MTEVTEDIAAQQETTEAEPSVEDSSYAKILEGDGEAPDKSEPSVNAEDETNPEGQETSPEDREVVLEVGGKQFTMKESEAVKYLENASKMTEREKALAEKEKSLNRDYTQKSQQNAEFRKSVETTFGRFPDKSELDALGKIWKSYFTNPQAKETIDSILAGRKVDSAGPGQPQGQESQLVGELRQEIDGLKAQLGEFTNSMTEREQAKMMSEAKATWDGWAAKKAEAGVKITNEIDARMAPFIAALRDAHPDKPSEWILDTAYKHATIDDIEKQAAGNVLKSADKAKKSNLPKITPKSSAKPDSEKSYAEIFMEG